MLEEPACAVFAKIQNENQREWLPSLAFAREIGDAARLAVVEDLKVFRSQVRDWQVRFLVFYERVKKHHARFDPDGIFDFLRVD